MEVYGDRSDRLHSSYQRQIGRRRIPYTPAVCISAEASAQMQAMPAGAAIMPMVCYTTDRAILAPIISSDMSERRADCGKHNEARQLQLDVFIADIALRKLC